jgi:hypothetical protein
MQSCKPHAKYIKITSSKQALQKLLTGGKSWDFILNVIAWLEWCTETESSIGIRIEVQKTVQVIVLCHLLLQ